MYVCPEIQKEKVLKYREPQSNRALFEKFGMSAKREHPDGTDPYSFKDPYRATSTLEDLAAGATIANEGERKLRKEAALKAAEEEAKKHAGEEAIAEVERLKAEKAKLEAEKKEKENK